MIPCIFCHLLQKGKSKFVQKNIINLLYIDQKKQILSIIKMMISNSMERVGDYLQKDEQLIDITFNNIYYQVQANSEKGQLYKKTILHGVSGIFKAKQLNVIMGASGAGKTTLLNILAGRITDFTGELLANDTPYDFQSFGGFANYVMQGDILMQTMTVKQTLEFAARLKDKNEDRVQNKIRLIVQQLKLQKCLDVVVGGNLIKGISGGEKKRTSIAVELISDPQVFVLDQPTSGMDSLTSFIIINQLKILAKQGKTIFLTIHQPNSQIYALFDNLLLMIDGKIIYQGSANESLQYFAHHFSLQCPEFENPADYYMSIMHFQDKRNTNRYGQYFQTYDKQIKDKVATKILQREKGKVEARKSQSQFLPNLMLLLKRDLLNILRNPIVMQSRIIQVIFMSIYTGGLLFNAGRADYTNVISWNAINGYFFFLSFDLFMQSLMPVAITFPLQRLVFLKQQNSKMYTLTQYYASRNVIEIPYILIIPMIFLLISYWMIGLANNASQFFTMYFIIVIQTFTGTSLGMLIGSMVKNPNLISTYVSIVFLPLVSFSGFFKNYNNLPVWIGWIRFIIPFNYTYTALVGNETLHKASLIDQVNFDVSYWNAVLILFCIGVGYRILTYFLLAMMKDKLQ